MLSFFCRHAAADQTVLAGFTLKYIGTTPFAIQSEEHKNRYHKFNEELVILTSSEVISLVTNPQSKKVYFKRKIGDRRVIYSIDQTDLETRISTGEFSNFTAQKFQELSRVVQKKINPVLRKTYTLKEGIEPIGLILRYPPTGGLKLTPGEKFILVEERGILYLEKPPSRSRYIITNKDTLLKYFQDGKIHEGKLLPIPKPLELENQIKSTNKPSPIPKMAPIDSEEHSETNFNSIPTLKGTFDTVIETAEYLYDEFNTHPRQCKDFEENLHKNYEQCRPENDYIQQTLNDRNLGLLSEEDLKNNHPSKFCILAGLNEGVSFKIAQCTGGKILPSSKGKQVCKSNEYVSFIHKEMTQMAECFTNIEYEELIPLVNAESRFNFNAYNLNTWGEFKGELNASGILQSTQVLYTDANIHREIKINGKIKTVYPKAYLTNNAPKQYQMKINEETKYCKSIFNEIKTKPPSLKRNVCERTTIPKGFRQSLYLALANYSHSKQTIEKDLYEIQDSYFSGNELFDKDQKKEILTDLTRLMHNRGIGVFQKRMRSFFYDLFHGKYGQDALTRKGYTHGNAAIWKLWGRPNFKAPISHDEFIKYFSSYIFWEGKYEKARNGSRGKKLSPSDNNREAEGGTYLHKIACEQKRLTEEARELAGNDSIQCGYPVITPERMEKTQVEVGWYINVCDIENKQLDSKEICSAKDPYKATDENGKRRLNNATIKKYLKSPKLLQQCNHENLRGMASRPLIEFYAPNPKDYK